MSRMNEQQKKLSSTLIRTVESMVPEDVFYKDGGSPCFFGAGLDGYNGTDSHIWSVNFNWSDKRGSHEGVILAELAKAGIQATVEPNHVQARTLRIDTTQAGFADNLTKLMEQHRGAILRKAAAEIEFTKKRGFSAAKDIGASIPQLPNGEALDKPSAAALVAEHEYQLAALKKALGIEKMVAARLSPRSGRARSVDEE